LQRFPILKSSFDRTLQLFAVFAVGFAARPIGAPRCGAKPLLQLPRKP
jgi:hypothetical protein